MTFVGEYWLQSTLFRASFAALSTNSGGLYPLCAFSERVLTSNKASGNSQEALTHVYNGLNWRSRCRFIDDRPLNLLTILRLSRTVFSTYHTSCFCPATLAAGLKGSSLMADEWNPFATLACVLSFWPVLVNTTLIPRKQ